jgi:hypothetical protein
MPDFKNLDGPGPEGGPAGDPDAPDAVAGPGADVDDAGGASGRGSVTDMAMSTDPSPSLDAVEDPWDPDKGGTTRIFRGLQKAFGASGIPAIGDVLIGVVEVYSAAAESNDAAEELNGEELTIEGEP